MFRIQSITSGSSLLRSPATLLYISRSQRILSTATTPIKEDWKALHSGGLKAAGVACGSDLLQPSQIENPKKKSTRRRAKTGSNADKSADAAAKESGERITSGYGALKKPKRANNFSALASGALGQDELCQYLTNRYMPSQDKSTRALDMKRVHVLSKPLCDDILDRMKPSLEKHIGCDIIDLNPGPGVWSSALHDFLKPRTHILMEPDHASYKPLLKPLLDAEGSTYKFIPKSGVIWSSLQEALSPELLPCQKALDHGDSRLEEPNHTLLLVANLGYNPRKPYRGFLSLPSLVIYQLLSAARSHSLFHKYGLIRMLIWVDDEEKRMVLPRNIVNRRKGTIEAEVTCSDIVEVASSTDAAGTFLRDHTIDLESSIAVLKRMKEAGIKTPQGRLGPLQIEATEGMSSSPKAEPKKKREFYKDLEDLERRFAAGEFSMLMDTPGKYVPSESLNKRRRSLQTSEWTHMATLTSREKTAQKKGKDFAYKEELHQLRERFAAGEFQKYPSPEVEMLADGRRRRAPGTSPYSPDFQRLQYLRRRSKSEGKRERIAQTLCEDYDAIMSMRRELLNLEGSAADSLQQEINERFDLWREEFALIKNDQDTSSVVCNMLDNRSVYYQDPPVLFWDRRKAEPLRTDPDEFFPRTGMALLDFQPRSMWPVLRENFPANYDVFEYIISNLLILPTQSVRQGLTSLAPGAFDWLIPECPSITDPNKGGNPDLDLMRVRCLSQEMYKEIIEAWMRWPFRPSRYELLGRVGSEIHDPDGDKFWATENQ